MAVRYKVVRIIEGLTRSALKLNQPMMEKRIEAACVNCYASHSVKGEPVEHYTGRCDKKAGGCGCSLDAKSRVSDEMCPQGVWQHDVIDLNRLKEVNKENNFNPNV